MDEDKIEIKEKPWGEEIWFAHNDKYAGKLLKINKGHRYSLQYHEQKRETQYLLQGKVKVTFGKDKENLKEITLKPGEKFDVPPKMIHRVEGLEESIIIEVSTPELNDVVKIDDDYGRTGKGNNEKLDEKLSNQT